MHKQTYEIKAFDEGAEPGKAWWKLTHEQAAHLAPLGIDQRKVWQAAQVLKNRNAAKRNAAKRARKARRAQR